MLLHGESASGSCRCVTVYRSFAREAICWDTERSQRKHHEKTIDRHDGVGFCTQHAIDFECRARTLAPRLQATSLFTTCLLSAGVPGLPKNGTGSADVPWANGYGAAEERLAHVDILRQMTFLPD